MEPGGRIIDVASIAGKLLVPGSSVYSGTMAGLRFWALAAAEDLAERGIGIGTVNPSPVDTVLVRGDFEHASPISASQPWSTPEQIASAVDRGAVWEVPAGDRCPERFGEAGHDRLLIAAAAGRSCSGRARAH